MRTIEDWMRAYGRDHQNPINQRIHLICVPLIMWSLFGLLWVTPFPWSAGLLNWAVLFAAFGLAYYLLLDWLFAVTMLVIAALMLTSTALLAQTGVLFEISLGVFVAAWIGQFIGHKIEGQKPSFLEDLQFLLIGPLWVLKEFGIRKNLKV